MVAWEKETDHRHHMDRKQSSLYATEAILGKIFAFLFVLTALGVCGYAASVVADWVAAIVGTGVIAAVVWAL